MTTIKVNINRSPKPVFTTPDVTYLFEDFYNDISNYIATDIIEHIDDFESAESYMGSIVHNGFTHSWLDSFSEGLVDQIHYFEQDRKEFQSKYNVAWLKNSNEYTRITNTLNHLYQTRELVDDRFYDTANRLAPHALWLAHDIIPPLFEVVNHCLENGTAPVYDGITVNDQYYIIEMSV